MTHRLRVLAVGTLLALLGSSLTRAGAQDRAFGVVPQVGPLKGKQVYANSYALIVGINSYPGVPRKWWLNHAVDDARAMKEVLVRSYGFPAENITLLTDGDATEKKIRNALAGFTSSTRIKKDDRVLVYFSGHGQTIKTPGDSGAEMGFLVPYDAEVDLKDLSDPEPYLRTCIPMRQVWEYLDASPAKHALVLADACYSGLLAKTRAFGDEQLADGQLQALANEKTRQVITAGMKGETAVELGALGHGAFTHSLLELLKKGAATPGDVFTSNQLYSRLFPAVGKLTEGKQTPQLSNHDTEGQFLFVVTPEQRVDSAPVAEDSVGRVTVRTSPAGARIYVDGNEVPDARTPYTVAVGLGGEKVRNVEIAVQLNGERKTSRVSLIAGRVQQLPLLQFTAVVPDLRPSDNRPTRDVVLITDCDADDRCALLHLAISREIRLRGIIATSWPGVRNPDENAGIVRSLLNLLPTGSRCPVLAGAAGVMESRTKAQSSAGVDFLLKTAREYSPDRRLLVLDVARTTDLASALLRDPGLADRIEIFSQAIMRWPEGGDVGNAMNDLRAWQALADSAVPLTVGDQVTTTRDLQLSPGRARDLFGGRGPVGQRIADEVDAGLRGSADWLAKTLAVRGAYPLWDQSGVAYALGYYQAETHPRPALRDDLSLGSGVAGRKVQWLTSFDSDRLWSHLMQQLDRLPRE